MTALAIQYTADPGQDERHILGVVHTLYYWDGPMIFIGKWENKFYICENVGDDQILVIAISPKRAHNIIHGLTTLRQAYKFPELRYARYFEPMLTNYFVISDKDWDMTKAKPLTREEMLKIRYGDYFRGGYHWWMFGKYLKKHRINKRARHAYKRRKGR